MYGNHPQVIKPPNNHVFHNSFNNCLKQKALVTIRLKEDKAKLLQRMCLSEHPFGTIKWYHGAHYLLCRGKEKASAELGLSCLAYNLKRAINLLGVSNILAAINN